MPATATKPKAAPFSKPKQGQDGTFEFKLPENIGAGRGRIPKGKYIGRCTSIINDTAKSSGNKMWTWEFVITKGPQAGRDFKLWTVLTDDAAWKVAETLTALGVKVTPGEKIRLNKKDVIGVGVTMHIKDDTGRDGDGEFSKLDKVSAHPNGAGFRSGLGAAAGKKGKQEPEDDRGYPEDMDDDDLDDDTEADDEDADEDETTDMDDDDEDFPDEVGDEDEDDEEDVNDMADFEDEDEEPAPKARKPQPKPSARPQPRNGKKIPPKGKKTRSGR